MVLESCRLACVNLAEPRDTQPQQIQIERKQPRRQRGGAAATHTVMLRGLLVSRLLVSLAAGDSDGLDALARCVHNAWVLELGPDPEQAAHWRNRAAREVRSGHGVGMRLPAALPGIRQCKRRLPR